MNRPAPPCSHHRPASVTIVEVGPRDGLQNEKKSVSTTTKVDLIDRLGAAGLKIIEATAFVSPKWVPQMADHAQVMAALTRRPGIVYPVLVPNLRGLDAALAAGATEVAVFAAASESFSRKNINCSIAESLTRFEPVLAAAAAAGVKVRGYVSCVLGCPYGEDVAAATVSRVATAMAEMGCYQISLGDTIGTGNPDSTRRLFSTVAEHVPLNRLAGHFHDSYGMAIANIFAALEIGVAVFDTSVAGLGGCPYAPGAAGNVATEDVVWLMRGLGIDTGIDLPGLIDCARWIASQLGRVPVSRLAGAWPAVSPSRMSTATV